MNVAGTFGGKLLRRASPPTLKQRLHLGFNAGFDANNIPQMEEENMAAAQDVHPRGLSDIL